MDNIELQELLLEVFSGFRFHHSLIPELMKLLDGKDVLKIVSLLFDRTIKLRHDQNNVILLYRKQFESVLHEKNLYSMIIKGKECNIRILYSYINGEVFLHSFYEREGKSKTAYTSAIKIAKSRREEIISEMEGE